MPTYEYRCPTGHDFEKFYRKISDAGAEVPCPRCGEIGVRMLSAGAGLVFKGSGFYITDYGKDGKKDHPAVAKSGSEGGGETSGSGETPSISGADSKAPEASKPAAAESKPAVKESSKSEAAPASKQSKHSKPSKPNKSSKPSTE